MKKLSKNDNIKAALLSGKHITTLWGMQKLLTSKLASRISDLRASGWNIYDKENRNKSVMWKEYFMTKSEIKRIKNLLTNKK